MEDGRKRALQDAITKIERSYGKGSIMRMGADRHRQGRAGHLHQGRCSFDFEALTIGGIPAEG